MLYTSSSPFARKSRNRLSPSMLYLVAVAIHVAISRNLGCYAFVVSPVSLDCSSSRSAGGFVEAITTRKCWTVKVPSQQPVPLISSALLSTRSNELAMNSKKKKKNRNNKNMNNLRMNSMFAEDAAAAAAMDTNDIVSIGRTASTSTTTTTTTTTTREDDNSLLDSYLIPNPGGSSSMSSSMRQAVWQGRALAILAAAIFGTNFSLVKFLDAGSDIPIATAAVLRFALASTVVSAVVEMSELNQKNNRHQLDLEMTTHPDVANKRHAFLSGGEVGLWYGAGYIAQAVGLHTVDASKSAFFAAMAVLFVPILDALFRSRPLTPNTVGSVVLALSGVALLQNAASFSAGDFTSLLQALFFGIGYFRLEAVSQRYPTSTARVLSGELWGTTLLALLYMMITDGIGIGSSVMGFPEILANVSNWLTDPSTLFAILWTGLISTSLALYLETAALTVLPASEVTILMTTISIWGSAFAYVLFGEVLGISGWMGGLLILAGCLLNTIPSKENMDNGLKSETTSTTASTSSIPIKMD